MFVEYFYYLKERLPVSITEYMTLMEALNQGLIHNMVEFYYTSRSILCKNEHHFDIYDIAFANFFKEAMVKFPEDIKQEIWDWLNKDISLPELIEGCDMPPHPDFLLRQLPVALGAGLDLGGAGHGRGRRGLHLRVPAQLAIGFEAVGAVVGVPDPRIR